MERIAVDTRTVEKKTEEILKESLRCEVSDELYGPEKGANEEC